MQVLRGHTGPVYALDYVEVATKVHHAHSFATCIAVLSSGLTAGWLVPFLLLSRALHH